MKKIILVIIGLTISLNSLAQMPTKIWITRPKSNDTIGYLDEKHQQFIITHQVTLSEFDRLSDIYSGVYTVVVREDQIIDQNKSQTNNRPQTGTSPLSAQSANTDLRGFYLVKAGEFKNASIAVSLGTSVIVGVILSDDRTNSINGYRNQTLTAGVVGALGGLIALGLNIAGNNMLIKAGLVK